MKVSTKVVATISKTRTLRQLVTSLLKSSGCEVYYEKADKKATFPYLVYTFDTTNFTYDSRDDIFLLIDIWDRRETSSFIEGVADAIEKLLDHANHPTEQVLATFYLESRKSVADEDELILHRQIRAKIESYYIGGYADDETSKS